jgi:LMBR1 domain-containing protein 1
VISYAFLSKAEVPVRAIMCSLVDIQPSNSTNFTMSSCNSNDTSFEIDVSFPIYTIGLLSFISWFLFVIFGGIGLAALPLDFIYDFNTRPVKMSPRELADKKRFLLLETKKVKELGEIAKSLEDKGALKKTIFSSEKREYNATMRKLRASVCVLDNEYQMIEIQSELNDEWVLKYWFGLLLGIICLILSLSWFIHIILYFIVIPNGQPLHPFLNNLLVFLVENNVGFMATAFFAMFCLYLLLAAIKGNVKFGLRILLCWAVHPMKRNETYINSFLFNISLILLCSVSVTQFCAAAFKDFAVMTDVDLIFTTQIRYMKFFRYFFQYHVFEYALFGFTVLSTIYLLCRPSDKNSLETLLAEKKGRGDELEESRGLADRK